MHVYKKAISVGAWFAHTVTTRSIGTTRIANSTAKRNHPRLYLIGSRGSATFQRRYVACHVRLGESMKREEKTHGAQVALTIAVQHIVLMRSTVSPALSDTKASLRAL